MGDIGEIQTGHQVAVENPNSQENLLRASSEFARYMISRWPQVNDNRKPVIEVDETGTLAELAELPPSMTTEPRLNYYFGGSLATMLLAQASSFTTVEAAGLPNIKATSTTQIPPETAQILASFARPMGDFDYIPFPEYRQDPNRLRKGGGGPAFDEIPEAALPILKKGENSIKVMCDPLPIIGEHMVARIEVGGQEYYIPTPDAMVGYKILNLLESYQLKPEKFNADFGKLLQAMRGLYTDEHLVEVTQTILGLSEKSMREIHESMGRSSPYRPKIPDYYAKVMSHHSISPEVREFLGLLHIDSPEPLTETPSIQPEQIVTPSQPEPETKPYEPIVIENKQEQPTVYENPDAKPEDLIF